MYVKSLVCGTIHNNRNNGHQYITQLYIYRIINYSVKCDITFYTFNMFFIVCFSSHPGTLQADVLKLESTL